MQALGQVGLRIGSTADHPTTGSLLTASVPTETTVTVAAKEAPALMLQHDDIIWLLHAADPVELSGLGTSLIVNLAGLRRNHSPEGADAKQCSSCDRMHCAHDGCCY